MVNKWLSFSKASLSDDEPKNWSGWNSMRQGPHALSERDATATRTEPQQAIR